MSRIAVSIGVWIAAFALSWLGGVVDCAQAQGAGKRVALVVGNSAYTHTTALANPANDARDIAAALTEVGFQVIEGLDLDKRGLDHKVRDFSRALAGADVGLFFYAGHGLQVSGQNYLVPVDAKLESERDLDFEAVKIDFLLRQMELDRDAKTNIVFLDACRDNPLSRNLARSMGTRSAALGRGLAQVQTGVGTFIAFSTQPGNVALDGQGRNSPFTAALAKHIRTPGKNLNALMIEVRKDVLAATQGKQVPWDHSALTGDFYFAGGGASAVAGAPGAAGAAGGQAEVAALQDRMRALEDELKRKNAPAAQADVIKIAELRARAANLEDLTKQLQSRLMTARMNEGRASDPAERQKLQRDSMNIQTEWTRRSLDLKRLRDELAALERGPESKPSGVQTASAGPQPAAKAGDAAFVLKTGTRIGAGKAMSMITAANHTVCIDQCRKTQGCVAIQHTDATGDCMLYSMVERQEAASGVRTAVKAEPKPAQ